jgi:hypothetical protein
VSLTFELGQNRKDKPGHDSNDRTAAVGELWTKLLGQDSRDRTAREVHPEKYMQDWKQKTRLAEYDNMDCTI